MSKETSNINEKIELSPILGTMFEKLIAKMREVGWVIKDRGVDYSAYFEYENELNRSWVVLYPIILTYELNNKIACYIWFKSGDKQMSEDSSASLFKIMKPFKDQDYMGSDFWINPYFPNGHFENHILS